VGDQEEERGAVSDAAVSDVVVGLNADLEIGTAKSVILVTLPAERPATSVTLLNRAILQSSS